MPVRLLAQKAGLTKAVSPMGQGGDGGNRTRVRDTRARISYKLSRCFGFHRSGDQRRSPYERLFDMPGLALALFQAYRSQPGCTSSSYDGLLTACEEHCEGRPDHLDPGGGSTSFTQRGP